MKKPRFTLIALAAKNTLDASHTKLWWIRLVAPCVVCDDPFFRARAWCWSYRGRYYLRRMFVRNPFG